MMSGLSSRMLCLSSKTEQWYEVVWEVESDPMLLCVVCVEYCISVTVVHRLYGEFCISMSRIERVVDVVAIGYDMNLNVNICCLISQLFMVKSHFEYHLTHHTFKGWPHQAHSHKGTRNQTKATPVWHVPAKMKIKHCCWWNTELSKIMQDYERAERKLA